MVAVVVCMSHRGPADLVGWLVVLSLAREVKVAPHASTRPHSRLSKSLRAGLTLRRLAAQGCAKGLGRSHPGHPGRLGSGNGGGHSTCLWPLADCVAPRNHEPRFRRLHSAQTVRGVAPVSPGADGRRFSRRPRAHAPTPDTPAHAPIFVARRPAQSPLVFSSNSHISGSAPHSNPSHLASRRTRRRPQQRS